MNSSRKPLSFFPRIIFLYQTYLQFFWLFFFMFLSPASAKVGKHQMKYYAPFDNGVYNPDTLATVKGSIVGVTTMNTRMTPLIFVPTVVLKVERENDSNILIQLAPYWYMMARPFLFKTGQEIEATGSMMGPKENQYLVAKKVTTGEEEETYRNDFGIPVWSSIGDFLADIEWEEK